MLLLPDLTLPAHPVPSFRLKDILKFIPWWYTRYLLVVLLDIVRFKIALLLLRLLFNPVCYVTLQTESVSFWILSVLRSSLPGFTLRCTFLTLGVANFTIVFTTPLDIFYCKMVLVSVTLLT